MITIRCQDDAKTIFTYDGTTLEGANLQGISLHRAMLITATLDGPDLTGADLFREVFMNADLRGAKMLCNRIGLESTEPWRAAYTHPA